MDRALIVGLAWLTLTAAISLVVGRAMLHADARQDRAARERQRARAASPVRWVAGPASAAGAGSTVAQDQTGRPVPAGPDRDPRPNCTITRPPRHGHPPAPRRPRGHDGA